MLFLAALAQMTSTNAIAIFRELRPHIDKYSPEESMILERLERLGFYITTAENDREYDSMVAKIKRCEESITFIHPRKSLIWINAGDRVIVPARPMGQHIAGSRRKKQLVYVYELEPVQAIRRVA